MPMGEEYNKKEKENKAKPYEYECCKPSRPS